MDFGDLQFNTNPNDEDEDDDESVDEKPIEDLIVDVESQLRYAFGQVSETTNLDYKNFELGIKEVFPGIPINKIKHIFENESNKNVLNYHKFLKSNTADAVIKNLMHENEGKTGKKYEKILENDNINNDMMGLGMPMNMGLIQGVSVPEYIEDQKDEIMILKKWKKEIGIPALNITKELKYKLNNSEQEKNILIDDLNRLKIDYDVKMGDLTTISNEILQLEERYNSLINEYQDTQRNAESYKNELENLNKLYKNELMKSNSHENVIKQLQELNESLDNRNKHLENELTEKENEILILENKNKALEDIIDSEIILNEEQQQQNNEQAPSLNKTQSNQSKSIDSQQIILNNNNTNNNNHQKKNSVIIFKDRKLSFVQMPSGRHRTMSIGTNNLDKTMDNEIGGDNNNNNSFIDLYNDYNSDNSDDYEKQIRKEIEKEMKKEWKDKITKDVTKQIEEKYRIKLKQNRLKIDMDFIKLNKKCQGLYTALQKQTMINKKLKNEYLKILNQNDNDDSESDNSSDNSENSTETDDNDNSDNSESDNESGNSDDDSNEDESDDDDSSNELSDSKNIGQNNVGCFPCLSVKNNRNKYKRMKSKRK